MVREEGFEEENRRQRQGTVGIWRAGAGGEGRAIGGESKSEDRRV